MAISIQDINLVPSEPAFLLVFTHRNCPAPILNADGTTQILTRPGTDGRLYCGNCQGNLDDEAAWAVSASAHPESTRSRMVVHDFRSLKRSILKATTETIELEPEDETVEKPRRRRDPRRARRRVRKRAARRARLKASKAREADAATSRPAH